MTTTTKQRATRLLLEARVDVRAAQVVLRTCAHMPRTDAPKAPAAPAKRTGDPRDRR